MDERLGGELPKAAGRLHELQRLERCERALAAAYRHHRDLGNLPEDELQRIAQRHLDHASLLRARIEALGGVVEPEPDDSWVSGTDLRALKLAEHMSLSTYHDHLIDLDEVTADALRRWILPDHVAALSFLDPTFAPDRDGEL